MNDKAKRELNKLHEEAIYICDDLENYRVVFLEILNRIEKEANEREIIIIKSLRKRLNYAVDWLDNFLDGFLYVPSNNKKE